jgi:hypothetical protein
MKRRDVLLGFPLLLGLPGLLSTVACSVAKGPEAPSASAYRELFHVPGPGGAPCILVCMPETLQTQEVWTGLSDELGSEFELRAVRVDRRDGAALIAEGIRRFKPSAIVLMNNPTVTAYREYLRQDPKRVALPSVVVMTSFLEGQTLGPKMTGISYEVPLLTGVTNLRKLLTSPVDRVGVICRPGLRGFVRRQAELARVERVRLVEADVSASPNASEIKRALRNLKAQVDALWILNDDTLLTPRLIASGWLPGFNERPFRPTLVGASSLVSAAQSFGTLALVPDHTALGAQAAELLFEVADNDWTLPRGSLPELPLSTTATLDVAQANERFALRSDALSYVDHIIG